MTGTSVGSTQEAAQLPTGGGLEALLEGGGSPTGVTPGEVSEVGTEKIKQDQANMAEIGKKLNSNFIPSMESYSVKQLLHSKLYIYEVPTTCQTV